MKKILSFIYAHASGLTMIIAGAVITFGLHNTNEGITLIATGFANLGLKIGTGGSNGTRPPATSTSST